MTTLLALLLLTADASGALQDDVLRPSAGELRRTLEANPLMAKSLSDVYGITGKQVEFVFANSVTGIAPNEPLEQVTTGGEPMTVYRVRLSAAFCAQDAARKELLSGLVRTAWSEPSEKQRNVAQVAVESARLLCKLAAATKKEVAGYEGVADARTETDPTPVRGATDGNHLLQRSPGAAGAIVRHAGRGSARERAT